MTSKTTLGRGLSPSDMPADAWHQHVQTLREDTRPQRPVKPKQPKLSSRIVTKPRKRPPTLGQLELSFAGATTTLAFDAHKTVDVAAISTAATTIACPEADLRALLVKRRYLLHSSV